MPAGRPRHSSLTPAEIEEILDLIPEQFQAGVADGSLIIRPQNMWGKEDRPVIVEAATSHIKAGRYKNANDPGAVSKATAYKRKRSYKEMQQLYITAEPGETKEQIISIKEIIEALWDAANGSPQKITCPDCGSQNVTAFKKDPNALFKLYENIVGKADVVTEINVNQTALIRLLQDQTPVDSLTVIELPPDQIYERRLLLESNDIDTQS